MTQVTNPRAGAATSSAGSRHWRSKAAYLGVLPFLIFSGLFLLYPTYNVILGAFKDNEDNFSVSALTEAFNSSITRHAFKNSLVLSFWTALAGSILGGLFAWALITGKKKGFFYRFSVALSSVLAQFGGVMLTFAFLATFGFNGVISTLALKVMPGSFLADSAWLYGLNGLIVVYTFFQIPLMVLVFLPTIENLRPQWREASDSLGGNSREYWTKIGIPVLTPSFAGAALLLFVNSFSAYATAATLINLTSFLTPLQIATSLSSEVGGANPAEAKALSFFMIVLVTFVMALYALLRRRVTKWEANR
ncbi:MAG: ABC transporter permease subunit [Candidatus Nanopelagicaceae bacterium]|nr:ABC transporter permease subunit [Candidatus Nanopelagicaceae bacterium]